MTMSVAETLGNGFKSDVRSAGARLLGAEKVALGSRSDTGVQVFVRVSPPARVQLSATGIADPTLHARCNCPVAAKGRPCKHIWAALLLTESEFPDFLHHKTEIRLEEAAAAAREATPASPAASARAAEAKEKRESYAAAAKARANEYRKAQYQKQKLRLKSGRGSGVSLATPAEESARAAYSSRSGRSGANEASQLPPEVEAACAYFSAQGFPMPGLPTAELLGEAKRKLSRVFHPDKGGTHEEIVELNLNSEVLLKHLGQSA